eukprot:TRINITY_DN1683_c0_g1_i1.p1 TRINITY_DN1683_c0_g1~~TRINITY_DN1683_c0_g1_i1.p1  ORF type:complete len:207 (-),score=73.36 TRINITY_DN1683_c0_g1_i1:262-882(-)
MANENEDYEDFDILFKLLLIGDSGVGKSCILVRFVDDEFEEDQVCTIGVDFKVKMINMQGKKINLTIWDTAGQEKFRSLTSSYYRGTNGIILVYDVTKKESFDNIEMWLGEVEMYTNTIEPVKLLVGNKVDKESDREVSVNQGEELAKEKGMVFIETSAKTKKGIKQAFQEIVQQIIDQKGFDSGENNGIDLHNPESEKDGEGCSC